jgi:hypothetical protein
MLLHVVLYGALMADLNRPISDADLSRCIPFNGDLVDAPAEAYRLLRGRVLAARIRPGMAEDEVQQMLYENPRTGQEQTGGCDPEEEGEESTSDQALGVRVEYVARRVRDNGRPRLVYVAVKATGAPLVDIAALFLPDFQRRRCEQFYFISTYFLSTNHFIAKPKALERPGLK